MRNPYNKELMAQEVNSAKAGKHAVEASEENEIWGQCEFFKLRFLMWLLRAFSV